MTGSHLAEFQAKEVIHIVELQQYDMFVGHPYLIHSGTSALDRNIRLHYYRGLSFKDFSYNAKDEATFSIEGELPTFNRNVHLTHARSIKKEKKSKSKRI